MKDPLIVDEEKKITKEDLKQERELKETQKAIDNLGYKDDPYLNSNCLSRLFFFWVFRIIRLANKTPLKPEYLGKMSGSNSSRNYSLKMYEIWDKLGYKNKKNGLIKTIFSANKSNLIIALIISLLMFAFEFSLIDIFRELIQSMDPTHKPFIPFMYLGISYFTVKLINIMLNRQNAIFQAYLGFKSSVDLNCFIYTKLLKASPSSLKEKSKEGEIINFIQVDSNKLNMTLYLSPGIIIIPIKIIFYSFKLFQFFGFSFLSGFFTLVLSLTCNFFIQKKLQQRYKEMYKLKDERMKVTTETFNNLKVLKLYSWEDEFLNRINVSRENEIKGFSRIFNLSILSNTLLWSTPVLVSVASIGVYQYFAESLNIADILTCITIFNAIQEPIRMLPFTVNNLIECMVSLRRIEKYLHQDDIDESRVLRNDQETMEKNIALKITNASFSWGIEVQNKDADTKEKKNEQKISNKKVAPIEADKKSKKKKEEKNDIIKISDENAEKRNLLDEEEVKIADESSNERTKNNIEDQSVTTLMVKSTNNINNQNSENENETEIIEDKASNEQIELKKILKNINFEVKKGELVAIIGEVGAGKSSLLQAILNSMIVIDEEETNNNTNDISNLNSNEAKETKIPKIIVNGDISYVSQISWIENDTLKNNVLFNQPFESEKYEKILEISQLKPDIDMLVGGDMTEIGEKGINLSGGQKARVSIARAIYTDKDIYIFDDPISALDAHVGEKIMKECILGYLNNKTRILVTHALQYLKFVDRIVMLKEGRITWEGNYDELINQEFYSEMSFKLAPHSHNNGEEEGENEKDADGNPKVQSQEKLHRESLIEENLDMVIKSRRNSVIEHNNKEDADQEATEANEDLINENELLVNTEAKERKKSYASKLSKENSTNQSKIAENEKNSKAPAYVKGEIKRITVEEDKEVGSVKWSVYFSYLRMMGGFCFFLIMVFTVGIWQSMRLFSDWYLTYWTKHQSKETNLDFFWKYGAISLASCFLISIQRCLLYSGSLKTSRYLHQDMLVKLVRAPINLFHDTIPKGQILNRISKDLSTIDTYTSYMYGNILVYLFCFFGAIAICSYMNIWCLIFLPIILIVGLMTSRYYMNCSRDLSRIDGIIRSPIINLLSATIPGAATIRAFHYEDIYKNKFYDKVDEFYKVRLFVNGAQNWFGMSIDILSITFLGFLIVFLVLFKDEFSSQNTGLMLTYYIVLQDNIFSYLSYTAYFENAMVSLERCLKYLEIPQEKPNEIENDKSLVSSWPREGRILFKNFSVKYRPDNEIILRNLNFEIKPKEKVGVVGRTGSGKSTLCLCLFRILEPLTGSILIDDIDITNVGLKLLRSSITIIPQDPNLMEGTLKYNIDPLNLYTDEQIREVLQMIGFWYIAENNPKGLGLNITESGTNLSVGEKQLICITRAILRKSKIIVMDEATSSIDIKTEDVIQKAINEVMKHSTVITIAHRIKTIINYDKILVLDYGEIKEYDSPRNLIQNQMSLFYELYKRSSI